MQRGRERVAEAGGEAAVLGRIFGMARHPEQRLPCRVGRRVGIAVLVGVPDRRDRAPELVEELRVEAGDPRVGRDDLSHREQMRRVDEIHPVLRDDALHRLVVLVDVVPDPEVRDRLLLGGADGAVERTVGLGLVQVLRVQVARERRRRLGAELRGLARAGTDASSRARASAPTDPAAAATVRAGSARSPVARRRGLEAVAGAEGDDVVRRRLADRDAARRRLRSALRGRRCTRRRRSPAGRAGSSRASSARPPRPPPAPRRRGDRDREVVVGLVASRELRHGVVHGRLHVRHVDHAVCLDTSWASRREPR